MKFLSLGMQRHYFDLYPTVQNSDLDSLPNCQKDSVALMAVQFNTGDYSIRSKCQVVGLSTYSKCRANISRAISGVIRILK